MSKRVLDVLTIRGMIDDAQIWVEKLKLELKAKDIDIDIKYPLISLGIAKKLLDYIEPIIISEE